MSGIDVGNPEAIIATGGIATELNLTGPFNIAWTPFADGDATPDISAGTFFNTANTGATSITDFDGNTDCLICVKSGDALTTLVHDATKLFLRGGLDTDFTLGDIKWFAEEGGVWYELPNP